MSTPTYPAAEQLLLEERAKLVHRLAELGADEAGELRADVEFADGFADAAAATAERTEVLGLVDSLKRNLDDVDRALGRIKEGLYGLCLNCGRDIGADRLAFRPESVYCVECQAKAGS
ncbi:MAG TPA: TraR/DksA C4-type zinc finger protein [Acidimicrobiia bacterium]|nr:TraR/DksA C4-type zinc finger protein [Acidimicrobiia bacterium]